MNFETLHELAKDNGSSFYIFYPDRFRANINEFSDALSRYYPNSTLAYAFKANYLPFLGRCLKENACWGEVVSGMEYDIARLEISGSELIFNGPCKSMTEINKALEDGATVNLDSFYELDLLSKINFMHKKTAIGIRVNFDIGTGCSRFGFNYENGDFTRAVKVIRSLKGVVLTSLHSHFTTKERSLELFEKRVRGMIRVYDELEEKEHINSFNIGGGFFGPMSEDGKLNFAITPPSFEEYAKLIGGIVKDRFEGVGPTLFIEPGVSMVANTMDFVVQVLDLRVVKGKKILTVDGSVNNLFPTGSKYKPSYSIVNAKECEVIHCDVAGYTCMEHDILMSDVDIAVQPGDFIVFHNRGAYSNVYKPPFIKEAPPIIGVSGEVYMKRQSYKDVLSAYCMFEV